jgi:hypothetical protein
MSTRGNYFSLNNRSDQNDFYLNDRNSDNDFLVNESLINSIMRLRTSLEYYTLNRNTSTVNRDNLIRSMMRGGNITITSYVTSFEDYDNLEDVKVTLSDDEFNKLNVIKITCDDTICNCDNTDKCIKIGECHICLDTFNKNEEKVILKCNHYFHKECIYKWLHYEKTNCPICRCDVREEYN